jgi:hypothetical protein
MQLFSQGRMRHGGAGQMQAIICINPPIDCLSSETGRCRRSNAQTFSKIDGDNFATIAQQVRFPCAATSLPRNEEI